MLDSNKTGSQWTQTRKNVPPCMVCPWRRAFYLDAFSKVIYIEFSGHIKGAFMSISRALFIVVLALLSACSSNVSLPGNDGDVSTAVRSSLYDCYRLERWDPIGPLGEPAVVSNANCSFVYLDEVWFPGTGGQWLSIPENDSHVTNNNGTWEFRPTLFSDDNNGVVFYARGYNCIGCNIAIGQKVCVEPPSSGPVAGECTFEGRAIDPGRQSF